MDNEEMKNDEIMALSAIYGDDWKVENLDTSTFSLRIFSENDPDKIHPSTIEFRLQQKYPSEAKPMITISAPWMSREDKSMLIDDIDTICDEHLGKNVLYMIIEKVKQFINEKISFEKIEESNEILQMNENIEPAEIMIYHGSPITDRKSTFQAHLAFVESLTKVKNVLVQLKTNKKIDEATHNIYAYRIIDPERANKLDQDYDDDGETHAGSRLLKLLENMDAKNVLVIVSRWFGGTLLGVDRFRHIQNVAKELLVKHNIGNK